MSNRSARTTLALSAALALTVALAPAATFAKGPGNGSDDCDGDCTAEQPQAQQPTRARDGSGEGSSSGQQTATKTNAGGGGQVQARAGSGGGADQNQATNRRNARQNQSANQNTQRNANQNANQKARAGAGQGPNDDGERGPGTCDDCDAEMGEMTDEQAAGVLFMANEEKLAHDVYAFFAEQYGVPIFSNIANSEARHQEAVNVVLQRYGLKDTTIDLLPGVFSNDEIAALYHTLIAQGSASLEEAIAVGVLIEELDIKDLQDRMANLEQAESEDFAADVHEMYSHLLAGSQNHLAAFEGWL